MLLVFDFCTKAFPSFIDPHLTASFLRSNSRVCLGVDFGLLCLRERGVDLDVFYSTPSMRKVFNADISRLLLFAPQVVIAYCSVESRVLQYKHVEEVDSHSG